MKIYLSLVPTIIFSLTCLSLTTYSAPVPRFFVRKSPELDLTTRNAEKEAQDAIGIFHASAQSLRGSIKKILKSRPLQFFRSRSLNIHHVVESSFAKPLEPSQLEELRTWKMKPEISNFLGELELAINKIVEKFVDLEPLLLGPENLQHLMEGFAKGQQLASNEIRRFLDQFIQDIYKFRSNSNVPATLPNVYQRYKYEIYKNFGSSFLENESNRLQTLTYIRNMYAEVKAYYEEDLTEINAWEEKILTILRGYEHVYKCMNSLKNDEASKHRLINWLNNIQIRSGDERLCNFLEEAAQKKIPIEKVRHFLLSHTKGIDSTEREDLIINTHHIFSDMWGAENPSHINKAYGNVSSA